MNTNGILSFRAPFTTATSQNFPRSSDVLIAPFWDDVNTNVAGNIFYRFSSDQSLLGLLSSFITDGSGFSPTSLFIATWDRVGEFGGSSSVVSQKWKSYRMVESILSLQVNTFQAVLATDGSSTYVLFLYEDIQWGDTSTSIGFNAGDNLRFFNLDTSTIPGGILNIENSSNVGVPGRYIFRVDQNSRLSSSYVIV